MNIKILGGGCPCCNKLEMNTIDALTDLGIAADIDHITDYAEIVSYGVMSTPALVVDGKVVSSGKALSRKEIIDILKRQ